MCLGPEWFSESENRSKKRNVEGVSAEEARSALQMYRSTVWPIATEMAEWLYKNWTIESFMKLDEPTRSLLLEVIEERILRTRSPQSRIQALLDQDVL